MDYTTNYKFNLPQDTDYAKITPLNSNFNQIDTLLKANSDAIGKIQIDQTYDPESENAQSGIAVAEGIEAAKEDIATELEEYVDTETFEIKRSVDELSDILDKSINLYNVNTNTVGIHITSTGTAEYTNASATDYIYLTAGTYYVTGFPALTGTNLVQRFSYLIRYDINKVAQHIRSNFNSGSFTMDYDGYVRFSGVTLNMQYIVLSKDEEATEYVECETKIKQSYFSVDQTYDSTSTNPVSGVAVAEAISQIKVDVDTTVEEGSTNPVSGDAVKTYVDTAMQNDSAKVNLQDIQGTSCVGSMTSMLTLYKENLTPLNNGNNVVEYNTYSGWNTYILKVSEVGTYTAYVNGYSFRIGCVSEDKSTITVDFVVSTNKLSFEIDENTKYILISCASSVFDYVLINKGTNTSVATIYELSDVFNDYANEYGIIYPDNIVGVKNTGDLICRAKLYKADRTISYANDMFKYLDDTTQDVYLIKIPDDRTYTMTSSNILKILYLDEEFIPVGTIKIYGSATTVTFTCDDTVKYLLFTMVKGYESGYHISVGDTAYEEPIYEGFGGSGGSSFDYTQFGMPILYLTGDVSTISKDNAVTLDYVYGDMSGTCTLKWQGSSSLNYPKKNYTVKFDTVFEAKEGWGEQKKYCLKANYIDFSHARNVVSAKLWGQVVKSRLDDTDRRYSLPNAGAVDGFPVLVVINDIYQGLYTFNIPKDAWMFGIDDENSLVVTVDGYSTATGFYALETDIGVEDNGSFEIEYKPDDVTDDEVQEKLNAFITAVLDSTAENFETAVGEHCNLDSFIDYVCFHCLITGLDGEGKNYILTSYDMGKWFITSYDMDSTYGNYWSGKTYVSITNKPTFTSFGNNLITKIITYMPDKIKERYAELRADVMSEDNVQLEFLNFTANIPKAIKDEECKLWPLIPGTETNNVNQIANHYKLRCKYIDEQVTAL